MGCGSGIDGSTVVLRNGVVNVFTLTLGILFIAAVAVVVWIQTRHEQRIRDLRDAVDSFHGWIEEYDRRLHIVEFIPWPESEERLDVQLAESPFVKDRRPPE